MVTAASTETMTDLRQFCSRHAARFWPVRRRALFTLVRNGTCMKCSERRILISFIRPMARPRFCTIRDAWRGARGRKAKRRRTPVWISSSRATARSRLFMFSSTRRPHSPKDGPPYELLVIAPFRCLRVSANFVNQFNPICPVQSPYPNIFPFSKYPNHLYIPSRSVPPRGVSGSSETRGGMRWTRQRQADA
jgi:hypothetical protein